MLTHHRYKNPMDMMGGGQATPDLQSNDAPALAWGDPLDAARTRSAARRAARAELGDRIAEHAFHLDAAMHRLLADVRAFDSAGYWADEGAVSCPAWLSWRVGWTPGTGREHVRVARALGTLPHIDGALRAGRLSYSKVRAITRVATPATEEALLNDALFTTAAQLETICRKLRTVQRLASLTPDDVRARRTVTRRERPDGMVVIEAVLPADEATIVFAAIEHEAARSATVDAPDVAASGVSASGVSARHVSAETPTPADVPATHVSADSAETPPPADVCATHVSAPGVFAAIQKTAPRLDRADGLVAMCQAALRGDAPDRSPVEVVLTITRDALTAPASAGMSATGGASTVDVGCLGDDTGVSAETARRLACDCGVVELHENAEGHPLSVGRRTRSIPVAIARALARRDTTCRFPGCTHRRFLDGHHVIHWAHGGETSMDNIVRLCNRHHRFVHEHGYRIEWLDGEPAFFHRGRRVLDEPPRVVVAPLGWGAIVAANAGLDVDATTGQSGWDGQDVQYEWVVDNLAYLELRRPTTRSPD